MSETRISKLLEINESVKNLKAVKCRIAHERVLIDKKTNLPITRYIGETVYERIGLCPPEVRKERIACGHTMAPYILVDALTILDAEGENIDDLRNELSNITTQIFQLDHKKGFAEEDLAILIEKKQIEPDETTEQEILSTTEKIKELANQHSKCVDKISLVQNRVIKELEKVIEKRKNG